jgi:pimeloyl-ACP methyl ester carboxylesterase
VRFLFLVGLLAATTAFAQGPVDAASRRDDAVVPTQFASARVTIAVEGSGPDVILIPGLTSHPRIWRSMINAVPGHRYHLVHVGGFAGAPVGANATGFVSAPVAEEIARYIRHAKLEQPAVIGHSMGGTIGLMLAARHPDAIGRLMVVDMLPWMGALFAPPSATAEMVRPIADQMLNAMRSALPASRRARVEKSIEGMINNEGERAAAIREGLASDQDVAARAFHELIVTDLRPELADIKVPVTVLYVLPTRTLFTPEQLDSFYRSSYAKLKDPTLTRIPNSAHFIMLDAPERFQSEVRKFLRAS